MDDFSNCVKCVFEFCMVNLDVFDVDFSLYGLVVIVYRMLLMKVLNDGIGFVIVILFLLVVNCLNVWIGVVGVVEGVMEIELIC